MGPTTYRVIYHLPRSAGNYTTDCWTERMVEFYTFPVPVDGVYSFPLVGGGTLYVGVAYFVMAEPVAP